MSIPDVAPDSVPPTTLRRALSARDGALLTIGSVVGTGVFLTAGDVAGAAPRPWIVLAIWLLGGALTLAGAISYAELGGMFPRAGGLYHFVHEAWGPLPAFLYGWTCLLVIMTGGIAAIAVGFGEYFGALVPVFSSAHVVLALGHWSVNGAQVAAAIAIVLLTVLNQFGVREGATVQNVVTWAKVVVIAALLALAFTRPAATTALHASAAPRLSLSTLTVALVAALWTYDGWYALTFTASEMRDPGRDLPRGLLFGVGAITLLYVLLNAAYLRALGLSGLANSPRAAEAAVAHWLGSRGGAVAAAAVALSAFGCLAASILYAARLYAPMADDGVFPRVFSRIHPRWQVPVPALWLQCVIAVALALSRGYTALFTYVTFGSLLFHLLAGLALFKMRAERPEAPRPYRAHGYPLVPGLFVGVTLLLAGATLVATPRESLWGLLAIGSGLPAYLWWRRARA
jgi:APA family basic amino acid/polyamine antiporter